MDEVMALGGLAAILSLSLPIALALEWLCLRGVFRFLPAVGGVERVPRAASQRLSVAAPRPATAGSKMTPAL